MKKKKTPKDIEDYEEMTMHQLLPKQRMYHLNLSEIEKMIKEEIETNLGFNLSDNDAKEKLSFLSKTIEIPSILYHYTS